jgi:hypothetical protein
MAKKPGFTLIETLMSFMIFGFVLLTVNFGVQMISQVKIDDSKTQFNKMIIYLENPKHNFVMADLFEDQAMLDNSDGRYFLKINNNQLKLIGEHGGEIPLMKGISKVKFSRKGGLTNVEVYSKSNVYTDQIAIPIQIVHPFADDSN